MVRACTQASRSGSPAGSALTSVAKYPGATAFTRMSKGPRSAARARVRPSNPALAAAYATSPWLASMPPTTEEMFTIDPPRCSSISLIATNRLSPYAPIRSVCTRRSKSAEGISSTPRRSRRPTLLIKMSIGGPPASAADAWARSGMSKTAGAASMPSARSSSTDGRSPSASRPFSNTAAPRCPSPRAIWNPRPFRAPVTRARRPDRDSVILSGASRWAGWLFGCVQLIIGLRWAHSGLSISLHDFLTPGPVPDQPDEPHQRDQEDDQCGVIVQPEAADLVDLVDPQGLDPEPPDGVEDHVQREDLA